MPSDVITNEELMARLKAHNYAFPPITPSTKGVLLKKLAQLDAERKKQKVRAVATNGQSKGRAALQDYSSGEEDVLSAPPTTSSSIVRRRTSNSSRNVVRSNGHGLARVTVPVTTSTSTSPRLMNYSENEDDEEEEDDEQDEDLVDDDDEDEDEEDVEDEEEDEEEEEEQEQQIFRHRNLAVQTSPRLDESSIVDGRSNGSATSLTSTPNVEIGTRFGIRFQSSTPIHPIPPSGTFLPTPNSRAQISSSDASSSTLRRAIAKNEKAFGSLGEALDTMPSRSTTNIVTSVANNNGNAKVDTKSAAAASRECKTEYLSKSSGFCNSHLVSKLIIFFVAIFFFFLFYKYSTLRPQIDVRDRLPICPPASSHESDDPHHVCVTHDRIQATSNLYRSMIELLENHQTCKLATESDLIEGGGSEDEFKGVSLAELKKNLVVEDEYDMSGSRFDDLMAKLIQILDDISDLGVRVLHGPDEIETQLSLSQPRVQWSCWIMQKVNLLYIYGSMLAWWALLIGGICISGYGTYRLYVWHQERILREKQDVFELVEQVLSLLLNQHQAAMRGGIVARSYLAINHIRDQLIPPQDRKRKQKLWSKVVSYIRESESRVREEVQVIYGEENRVWKWIPDITWGTINPNGPNPIVFGSTTSPAVFPPPSVPPFIPPAQAPAHASTQGSAWQGSAFSSLNKSVAAPSVAPTSCLKVRHMFNRQTMLARYPPGRNSQTAWMWQVKEEILQRCSSSNNAVIVHVAVDTESNEGCVYIKAMSKEDAAKAFSALHGQWYSGNLVTVKYMKEERYHERFPDSRHQITPLTARPSAKLKNI